MFKLVLAIAGWVAVSGACFAQVPLQKISGEVIAVNGSTLELEAQSRRQAIKLGDKLRVSARSPATLAAIVPGAYVGTTAVAQADGTLVASEVHIFAEALRGTGEGHRPMDGAPGATMTNATVSGVAAAPPRNTMTNATVANVAASSQGRKMTLTYTGGEKIVIVPADALVFATEAGSRDLLVPGAHVVVYAASQSDGTLASERISVGKNGYVPQM